MMYIVFYDISCPKRLRKLAKLCLDYGIRIQKSVFQFEMNGRDAQGFISKMKGIVDPEEDSILLVPVCEACKAGIQCFGKMKWPCNESGFLDF